MSDFLGILQGIGGMLAVLISFSTLIKLVRSGVFYLDNKELILAMDVSNKCKGILNAENRCYLSSVINYYTPRLLTGCYSKERRDLLLKLVLNGGDLLVAKKLADKRLVIVHDESGLVRIVKTKKYKLLRLFFWAVSFVLFLIFILFSIGVFYFIFKGDKGAYTLAMIFFMGLFELLCIHSYSLYKRDKIIDELNNRINGIRI